MYVISAETRDQLIDLLEAVSMDGCDHAVDAVNILPHIKGAPVVVDEAMAPESADPITAAKAEAGR